MLETVRSETIFGPFPKLRHHIRCTKVVAEQLLLELLLEGERRLVVPLRLYRLLLRGRCSHKHLFRLFLGAPFRLFLGVPQAPVARGDGIMRDFSHTSRDKTWSDMKNREDFGEKCWRFVLHSK